MRSTKTINSFYHPVSVICLLRGREARFCLHCCPRVPFKFPAPAALTQLPVLTWQQRTDHHWLQSACDRAACDSGGTPALSRDVRRAHADAWSPTGGATTTAATKRWIRHKACFLSLLMLIFFFFFFTFTTCSGALRLCADPVVL